MQKAAYLWPRCSGLSWASMWTCGPLKQKQNGTFNVIPIIIAIPSDSKVLLKGAEVAWDPTLKSGKAKREKVGFEV